MLGNIGSIGSYDSIGSILQQFVINVHLYKIRVFQRGFFKWVRCVLSHSFDMLYFKQEGSISNLWTHIYVLSCDVVNALSLVFNIYAEAFYVWLCSAVK